MKKIAEQDGFTLIEALIAMLVLTIGILTLSSMQISAIKGNSTANSLTMASSVATDCYERLMSVEYDDAKMDDTANANPHSSADFPTTLPLTLPPGVTSVSWSVQEWVVGDGDNDGDGQTDEPDEVGVKAVTLSVNYNDKAIAKVLTVNFYKHGLF
jgi:type IV pilus modification protein PilV